jgi:hypothetical protein
MHDTNFFSLYIDSRRNWINYSSSFEFLVAPFYVMFDRLIGVEDLNYLYINLIPLQRLANSTALIL